LRSSLPICTLMFPLCFEKETVNTRKLISEMTNT
jgi:hypothetical protein